ncbi:hypothetical protein BZG20_09485 [Salinivibrio sp. IB868]|nr:hypothetical protein BZG20_09485 [Salinivibrio sp. IB868]OOE72563.1 hypothetical protein BZG22_12785 [Salinivibrio sp. IB870]
MPTRYSTKKPNSNAHARRVLFCIGTLHTDFSKGGKFFPLSRDLASYATLKYKKSQRSTLAFGIEPSYVLNY